MSFTRAPVKRFNDNLHDGPAPSDYDPRDPKGHLRGGAMVKADRFAVPKCITPGPGQYNVNGTGKIVVGRNSNSSSSGNNGCKQKKPRSMLNISSASSGKE